MKVKLANVRLAYPALFEAKAFAGSDDAAFSAAFIFGKDHPAVPVLNKAIEEVATAKWGPKAADVLKEMRAKDKLCLHDGDSKAGSTGFSGNLYVSSRNSVRPLVIDLNKTPLTKSDGKPYAGCYVNANIELWAQDNQYGKRINASLGGVQFFMEGDAFTGGQAASVDDFDDLSQGASAAALA